MVHRASFGERRKCSKLFAAPHLPPPCLRLSGCARPRQNEDTTRRQPHCMKTRGCHTTIRHVARTQHKDVKTRREDNGHDTRYEDNTRGHDTKTKTQHETMTRYNATRGHYTKTQHEHGGHDRHDRHDTRHEDTMLQQSQNRRT